MLHNTGPYGPNEPPVNMGTPVNMTQMSSHMNLSHNINNLSKIAHQGVPPPSGHYNLPEYQPYSHSSLGMPPQMPQYPNYQPLGFQHGYMNQNANPINDLSWQNSMFPMNLNMQSEHNANMMNYAYDKRLVDSVRHEKEQNTRKMELNIPQIPNKAYAKHMETSYGNNDVYQNSHNLDLSMKTQEKFQLDTTRRKNIEHTVKLIEDILIQSSSKPRHDSHPPDETVTRDKTETSNKLNEIPTHRSTQITNNIQNLTKNSKASKTTIDPLSLSPKNLTRDLNIDNEKSNSTADSDYKYDSQDETTSDEEDIKPTGLTDIIKPQDNENVEIQDNGVIIKIEKASWADTECFTPFLKDYHGFQGDSHMDCTVIDGDNSVAAAIASYRSEIKSEGFYECPHCSLLFQHPKRFLIHYKWHTFGLTNEKRNETAKVREQRRFERKEAKILERMQSNEVTDVPVDGKVFPCKDCDKIFSSKGSLKNHRQRTHPARVRECKICHKAITSWAALRAHMATHTADSGAGFQCSECPKRFKYSHSLAKHSDTHLEKTHACSDCPKKFGSANLLKMHMKTHERVLRGATYRCTYCGKGFFESYNLQVHERTHRNERPFNCDICNTSFGTNSSLKRHIKVSHNTAKPYQCSVCRRNFSTESIRDRHEARVHGNPEDFKFPCTQCACKYTKLKDLQKHVYKIHPKGKRKKKAKKESDSE